MYSLPRAFTIAAILAFAWPAMAAEPIIIKFSHVTAQDWAVDGGTLETLEV